jgi:hypothetical protein
MRAPGFEPFVTRQPVAALGQVHREAPAALEAR